MFRCGDMVVYGLQGVCKIEATEVHRIDCKDIEYYVLTSRNLPDAKYYVPSQNPEAVAKMRALPQKQALDALLDPQTFSEDVWISDETLRREQYRALLRRADCVELIAMIRTVYAHKQKQLSCGKKLHLCDENFFRDAEKMVRDVVSYVQGIPQEQVHAYLRGKLGKASSIQ